jgi:hypothetical protein
MYPTIQYGRKILETRASILIVSSRSVNDFSFFCYYSAQSDTKSLIVTFAPLSILCNGLALFKAAGERSAAGLYSV